MICCPKRAILEVLSSGEGTEFSLKNGGSRNLKKGLVEVRYSARLSGNKDSKPGESWRGFIADIAEVSLHIYDVPAHLQFLCVRFLA